MPKPTVRRVLNEAEGPDGMFDLVEKDLYLGVSDRPTKHKVRVVGDGEQRDIAIEQLHAAAEDGGYTLTEDPDVEDGYVLTVGRE